MSEMSDNESVKAAMDALNMACSKMIYKSFKNLAPGEYIVNHFRIVDTIHGKRVRIDLDDNYMLLPERFTNMLTAEKIDVLNKAPKVMIYSGKDSTDRDRLILEFRSDTYFADIFDGIILK